MSWTVQDQRHGGTQEFYLASAKYYSKTLDEPEAESVGGGARPSKTDTAAPTSESNIESGCESEK